jgi:hypothetical protein
LTTKVRRTWPVVCAVTGLVAAMLAAPPAYGAPDDGGDNSPRTNRVAGGNLVADDGAVNSARDRHGHQHGGNVGHLPPRQNNVELVGKLELTDVPGRIADVTVFGNYAYLAAFSQPDCTDGGVYVVDISDVKHPFRVGFIPTAAGSFVGEGQQVISVRTPSFTGDVLIFNNEICADTGRAVGGATLVDVTNPLAPVVLASGFGDLDPEGSGGPGVAHQVHSAFAWTDGAKAYAVLVDDEEAADVDIFDITDPRAPVKVAEYDLAARYPQILQAGLTEVFFHDVVVKKIRGKQVMLASYWDAGYVLLDVTDPANAKLIADTDFTFPDPELLAQAGLRENPEGNGHEAEFTKDNRFMLTTDEDFNPTRVSGTSDDGNTFSANPGSDTPQLSPGQKLTGKVVYVGRACTTTTPPDAAVPPAPTTGGPYIAVAARGACAFTEKLASITAAGGYAAAIIVNREGPDGCGSFGMSVAGSIPTFGVDRRTGYDLFDLPGFDQAACLAGSAQELPGVALGTVGDAVTLTSVFNGWGYVHLFQADLRPQPHKLRELDTYAIPEAMDARFATGFGDLSVHEVATSHRNAQLAYLSYYAGGFRVIRIQDSKIVEVGAFIDQGGNNFWGVEVFNRGGREYVAASDRDFGLYIFRYTGRG